jgi:transcriptional regulator GlxA family with amidase domain
MSTMPTPRLLSFVLFPGFQLLDAAGPIAAFEIAAELVPGAYRFRLTATQAGKVQSSSGIALDAVRIGRLAGVDTLIVVGGQGRTAASNDAPLLRFLRRAGSQVPRIASVCSGALLLAAAGLLDGKRATTHWSRVNEMKRLYPAVQVEPDHLWVHDGRFWTSAGISAGIDLALALIATDCGPSVARDVARQLVVSAQRPGGQTQHSRLLDLGTAESRFAELNAWICDNLDRPLNVEALALRAKMSPRNFARAYTAHAGVTPAKAVERLRVEAARGWLEAGGNGIEEVAQRCGFGDTERMRRAFIRLFGLPPSALRRRGLTTTPRA